MVSDQLKGMLLPARILIIQFPVLNEIKYVLFNYQIFCILARKQNLNSLTINDQLKILILHTKIQFITFPVLEKIKYYIVIYLRFLSNLDGKQACLISVMVSDQLKRLLLPLPTYR